MARRPAQAPLWAMGPAATPAHVRMNWDMRKATEYYKRFPNNVRLVLADPEQIDECWKPEARDVQRCLKTADNMDGIPAWKLLALWYWDTWVSPGCPGC